MLSSFLLSVLPLALLGLFGILLIAELFWRIFARTRSLNEITNVADSSSALRVVFFSLSFWGLIVIPAIIPLASGLQSAQVSLALVVMSLVALLASRKYRHPDIAVFLVFSSLSSLYLLNASDIITVFFTLELLNSLVLYSFFFTASYSGASHNNAAARISASCVYQFTLNFFSSIVLYTGVVAYVGVTGGSSLNHAPLWGLNEYSSYSMGVFVSAFLLKFGTGPWIFFKINIYRNMNYQLVMLYSAVYMLVIFVFFLNLIFIFGAPITQLTLAVIFGVVIAAVLLFGSFAFQNPNTFVFISFSSLMNMGVFVLQAITVA